MTPLSAIRLRTKLILGFGSLAVLLLLLAAFSLLRVFEVASIVKQQNKLRTEKLELLYVAREALDQTGIAARNAFIFTDDASANRELGILDQQRAVYLAALTQLTPVFKGDSDFERTKEELLRMAQELDRPRKYRDAGQMTAYGEFLVKECSPLRRKIVDDIDIVVKSVQLAVDAQSRLAEEQVSNTAVSILVVATVALLLGIVVGLLITRDLLRQLGGEPADLSRIARQVAEGDLGVDIPLNAGDDSSIMRTMKDMRDSLVSIVGRVRMGTDAIAGASSQIAAGNLDLSSRTEEQASSLEKTASAMEELVSTVRQNVESARNGNELAMKASATAAKGGEVMNRVVGTMDSINRAAEQIANITSVIDGIAFQTNILALNAAVEAARAGEQGRGFAVVASEVRMLAQRSASAAREIKELIGDSVVQISTGSSLVREAGTTMDNIVDSVERVTAIMGEVLHASQEQGAGLEQVNEAVSQMDQATQQNAALVEQAAAAAQSLEEQSQSLAQAVRAFRLEQNRPATVAGRVSLALPGLINLAQ